jgi:hypothetical protein
MLKLKENSSKQQLLSKKLNLKNGKVVGQSLFTATHFSDSNVHTNILPIFNNHSSLLVMKNIKSKVIFMGHRLRPLVFEESEVNSDLLHLKKDFYLFGTKLVNSKTCKVLKQSRNKSSIFPNMSPFLGSLSSTIVHENDGKPYIWKVISSNEYFQKDPVTFNGAR